MQNTSERVVDACDALNRALTDSPIGAGPLRERPVTTPICFLNKLEQAHPTTFPPPFRPEDAQKSSPTKVATADDYFSLAPQASFTQASSPADPNERAKRQHGRPHWCYRAADRRDGY